MPLPFIIGIQEGIKKRGGGPSVLALDLGRKTGTAVLHHNGDIGHDLVEFPRKGFPGDPYNKFRLFLTKTNKLVGGLDYIFYEEKTFAATSIQNARVAFSFEGNLLSWCSLNKVQVIGVSVSAAKIFATGNGHAPKDEKDRERKNKKKRAKGHKEYTGPTVLDGVRQLGFSPQDDNVADACAILALAMERLQLNDQKPTNLESGDSVRR